MGMLPELAGVFAAQVRVSALLLVADRFPHVVQERRPLGQFHVQPQLRRHHPADERRLARVHEIILSVARTVFELAQQLDQIGVHVLNAEVEHHLLGLLDHQLLDVLAHFLDDFLDARGVNPPVVHQPLQRDLGDLAAKRVEPGDNDRFGRVVDHQIDAGRRLQRPDVTAFTADDPALHLVVRELEHRHGGFVHVVVGVPLDRRDDDLAGFPLGRFARLVLDALGELDGLEPRLLLHAGDQHLLRLFGRHAADRFELSPLLEHGGFDLELLLGRGFFPGGQFLFFPRQIGFLAVGRARFLVERLLALI